MAKIADHKFETFNPDDTWCKHCNCTEHGEEIEHVKTKQLTANDAKKIIQKELDSRGLSYTKLTARTIGFTDLARDSKIFVKIHGWKGDKSWDDIKKVAHDNHFCIEA